MSQRRRPQPPRVGELVADSLRAAILSGELGLCRSSASALYDREEFDEPEIAKWQASVRDHERLAAAIEAGDAAVAALALAHLEATHAYMSSVDDRRIVTAAATAAVR
jgi:DNA-binding GntR family transcriptional regulator